jgi:hypothetical protein
MNPLAELIDKDPHKVIEYLIASIEKMTPEELAAFHAKFAGNENAQAVLRFCKLPDAERNKCLDEFKAARRIDRATDAALEGLS